jgi:hypothetical protein
MSQPVGTPGREGRTPARIPRSVSIRHFCLTCDCAADARSPTDPAPRQLPTDTPTRPVRRRHPGHSYLVIACGGGSRPQHLQAPRYRHVGAVLFSRWCQVGRPMAYRTPVRIGLTRAIILTRDFRSAPGVIRTPDARFRNLAGRVALSATGREEAGQRVALAQGSASCAPDFVVETGNWMGKFRGYVTHGVCDRVPPPHRLCA